jgi:hypothetical protein
MLKNLRGKGKKKVVEAEAVSGKGMGKKNTVVTGTKRKATTAIGRTAAKYVVFPPLRMVMCR